MAGMDDQAPDSLIPYDEIVQEALRAVVARVLGSVATGGGLPGEHHFYITFKTQAAGVDIPKRLIERFPDEMTIVIQNRFWDLTVDGERFSVGLSFNQVPSKLVIPYSAITGFHDPAVNFELRFQAQEGPGDGPEPHDPAENDGTPTATSEDGSNVVSVDFKRKK
ncbi:stringent starvation protein B [Sphingomonas dokdonensis]|uniref:Stringent starvation protein B n=2 Tax=Sphingomonas dokdonensis TaxID=344880 RepID=A0A245ZVY3_9SPHN|nr:stringent starvation protein B [Sphingomonas dokdonensis]